MKRLIGICSSDKFVVRRTVKFIYNHRIVYDTNPYWTIANQALDRFSWFEVELQMKVILRHTLFFTQNISNLEQYHHQCHNYLQIIYDIKCRNESRPIQF